MLYETIFNIFNSGILLFWILLLFFPKQSITQKVIAYPWVPLVIAFGYIYFMGMTSGTFSADLTSLNGLTKMFQNANPQGVAANNEQKNIELVHFLIDLVDEKLKRPKGDSLSLIKFVTDRLGHDYRYAIDTAKIQSKLGWKSSTTFEEGINKTVEFYL